MQISALDAIVSNGGKVPDHDFKMLAEVLMQHLTELDRIHAEGEAKVQRRIEVSQIEFLVDLSFHKFEDFIIPMNLQTFNTG